MLWKTLYPLVTSPHSPHPTKDIIFTYKEFLLKRQIERQVKHLTRRSSSAKRHEGNTCSSGTIIGTRFIAIPEDLEGWVATDAIFAAYVAVGSAVNLSRKANNSHFSMRHRALQFRVQRSHTEVDKVKWSVLCSTLASETMPFKRVAAASYSGAKRLQWPHLKSEDMD